LQAEIEIMANVKKEAPVKNNLFGKENYTWMLIGMAVLALGFFLMAGGKSSDPKVLIQKMFTALPVLPLRLYSSSQVSLSKLLQS
jgi:hypothetical protein